MAHTVIEKSVELRPLPSTPSEPEVTNLAQMAIQRAIGLHASHLHPDFGPFGIGRLPNDLDGYPEPVDPTQWRVDHTIHDMDNLPAYILAGRQASQELAC